MKGIQFDESTLYISARSPFARRVRLAFLEHGVRFEEKTLDVFKPTAELLSLNPLRRVPALRLASGETLIDSTFILHEFYRAQDQSTFLPREENRLLCARWSAFAVGLCEKLVEYFIDSLHPSGLRDHVLCQELEDVIEAVLPRLDAELSASGDTIAPQGLTQTDLDLGAALAYLSLRHSSDWEKRFPRLRDYFARLDARESFRRTRPPAA